MSDVYSAVSPSDEIASPRYRLLDATGHDQLRDAPDAHRRLQALIANWLRMENVVCLLGAGCSVSESIGGKTMGQTILSQCANLFVHRLQNPQDIEHFKSIIPEQARRLLDQIMVLAQGEVISFGSAFHIPTRVQIHRPSLEPYSQTSAPYWEWHPDRSQGVDLEVILKNWGLQSEHSAKLPPPSPRPRRRPTKAPGT
jgi:hypothetical protein